MTSPTGNAKPVGESLSDSLAARAPGYAGSQVIDNVEGMTGIEPAPSVWKTEALPLSYIPRAQSPAHSHSVVHVDGRRLHVPARGIRTVQ